MTNKNKKSSGINQGYTKYSKDQIESSLTSTEVNPSNLKKIKKATRYPKGYLSLLFIFLISLAIFLICYLVKTEIEVPNTNETNKYHLCWQDCLSAAFGVGFFCNLLWLYSRLTVGMGSRSKYTAQQMIDLATFKPFRQRKNWVWIAYDIKTLAQYEEYCKIKKKSTTKVFYFSLAFFTVLFIVSIILTLTNKGSHYVLA